MKQDGNVSELSNREVPGLVRDIRRLGRRLLTVDSLSDPQVQAALQQLDSQLAGLMSVGGGRHRLTPGVRSRSAAVRDTKGYNLKPNPLTATTAGQLVDAMRAYRSWAGNVPYRAMADRAHHAVAHSTMFVALNSSELPALPVVIAIIRGCGGSSDDQEKFATAWRRINSGGIDGSTIALLT
jgi:hypothetical protein